MTATESINPQSTMREVLEAFPGAQRGLFRKYHIGGCSSCAFSPSETLEQLCARNGYLNVSEMLDYIRTGHEDDAKILISPGELAEMRRQSPELPLLDVRTREEHEAVKIEGAVLMNQQSMQEMLSKWPRERAFVIYDHTGKQGLDAAAYFLGHGFSNVRCLRGGIDAWAAEVDKEMPRYTLG
ncbi:MAG TPA: rhodanese-like domain-containing protein [Candidatus Saccharimonadales bacterium]|nr:rhodanese-like domain-containing protein [Candidatus Saccharimonadales bacterium]